MKKAVKISKEENWARKLDTKTLALLSKMKSSISSKLRPKSKDDEFWESITSNIGKKKEVSAPLPLSKIIPSTEPKASGKVKKILAKAKNVKLVYANLKTNLQECRKKRLELHNLEANAIEEIDNGLVVEKMKSDIRNITLRTLSKLEKHAKGNDKEDIIRVKKKLKKH